MISPIKKVVYSLRHAAGSEFSVPVKPTDAQGFLAAYDGALKDLKALHDRNGVAHGDETARIARVIVLLGGEI